MTLKGVNDDEESDYDCKAVCIDEDFCCNQWQWISMWWGVYLYSSQEFSVQLHPPSLAVQATVRSVPTVMVTLSLMAGSQTTPFLVRSQKLF